VKALMLLEKLELASARSVTYTDKIVVVVVRVEVTVWTV
jgi:hypothetical protein